MTNGCDCEKWTLLELSNALNDLHKDKKRIVVPMFQRGKRWSKGQESAFIDSLRKGYPVGTMLFYEKIEGNSQTYILVDGLQRGNCIKKYIGRPTDFFEDKNLTDDLCRKITHALGVEEDDEIDLKKIREDIINFIKEQKDFSNIQYYRITRDIAKLFGMEGQDLSDAIDIITQFFNTKQEQYNSIANTVIPVLVYRGNEDNLPEIFDRINSKGTPLDQYEVYAAAWPVNRKFKVNNSVVVESIIKKYDSFTTDGFIIYGYDREKMRSEKELNAFEYLFGLSRYLTSKYPNLAFNTKYADDKVNPLAFELVNACLNDSDKIKVLYKQVYDLDVNKFEKALCKAIDYVNQSVAVITQFKGNKRTKTAKLFHSKYQIMSMIATAFKEMFDINDLDNVKNDWNNKSHVLSKNLLQYYVYDIITKYWSEGGTGKIYTVTKTNRYFTSISSRLWINALDGYFAKTLERVEKKNIANPSSEDYVILNSIYKDIFTASDQLSGKKFDVEHIAPKEQMNNLLKKTQGEGLPISCIANLCYLPEYVNRSKQDKNFYQDKKYLESVNLKTVEDNYSFTEESDLEWMDMPHDKDDFPALKESYIDFCTKRFDKLKHLFCKSFGIEYVESEEQEEEQTIKPEQEEENAVIKTKNKTIEFGLKCMQKLSNKENLRLDRIKRSAYKTTDGENGYILATSKLYPQGKREKFWFAYRENLIDNIRDCKNRYYIFGCKDENTVIKLPYEVLEEHASEMNTSLNTEGEVYHYHVVFFKDPDGTMKWLLSHPKIHELDITKYLL